MMGMYTRLKLDLVLRSDTPSDVVVFLVDHMTPGNYEREGCLPPPSDHEFFSHGRWNWIITNYTCNGYECDGRGSFGPRPDGAYDLKIRTSLKNYESEIELFLAWVRPYVVSVEGEYEYEEWSRAAAVSFAGGHLVVENLPLEDRY